MSKKFVFITIIISIFLSVNTVRVLAQGPNPTAEPPLGYGKETNLDWFEICSADDYSPLTSGFYPTSFPITGISTFDAPQPANYMDFMLITGAQPAPYQQEGLTNYEPYHSSSPQCIWRAYVDPAAYPGDTYDNARTAIKNFVNDINFADVSFVYSCNDVSTLGLLWRPYEIITRWNDYSETYTRGRICDVDSGSGYISKLIEPRTGRHISSIYVNFPTLDNSAFGDFQMLPLPSLAIDRVLIRGFYQLNPPTPTGVFTPTATPTGVPTQLFDWKFPIPTKIPAIRFPAWPTPPTVAPLLGTPVALLSLPLITPVYTATPTLVPLDFTIVLSYPTPGVFQTPTPTPEGTPPPGTECYAADFTGAELPAGWVVIIGEFTPGYGIKLDGLSGQNLVISNTTTGYFSSIGFVGTPAGYSGYMDFGAPGDYGTVFINEAFSQTISFDPAHYYSAGYILDLNNYFGYEGDAFLTSAPYCNTSAPATPTPTATPTLDDFIGPIATLSLNLQTEADAMSNTTTFTVETAPPEYAPNLPRPMANVGYTFENMPPEAGLGFGITAWSSLLGYAASIPFQLAKFMLTLADLLGPLGLFIKWLFILLPFVFFVKIYLFIKNLIISIINLIIKIVNFIGDIWDLIPGL